MDRSLSEPHGHSKTAPSMSDAPWGSPLAETSQHQTALNESPSLLQDKSFSRASPPRPTTGSFSAAKRPTHSWTSHSCPALPQSWASLLPARHMYRWLLDITRVAPTDLVKRKPKILPSTGEGRPPFCAAEGRQSARVPTFMFDPFFLRTLNSGLIESATPPVIQCLHASPAPA
ncbi:hypothetical protein PISMIDRAFT_17961 [Pisolithus microcarpus 441]|uniref:Uncharacterized protein n=1 Tax=Pisolithus microcarpus 441 TaxID=765257 RepID=A0A0C9Y964_9AGAM|nr:hypothetical protein PISMIDRAFT_17961 [Pisolithus microcarpus 441]